MSNEAVRFQDAIRDVSAGNVKIAQRDFLAQGALAVIDQGRRLIAGYTNDQTSLVKSALPLIVFGDHTRVFKFIDFPFAMGADGVKVLQVRQGFDPRFVYHYLRSRRIPNAGYSRHFKFLKETLVPRPSLAEQRRIAAILDNADALRAKRRQVLHLVDTLEQSIFEDMFDERDADRIKLSDIAEVSSGITKGRRTLAATRAVPYLAVSNVQAGFLDMSVVKEIEATEIEIERYALRAGDLVLTEGGDPDKLGRGTVWRQELPLCLHQNHIFRARPLKGAGALPEYLAAYIASKECRSYFLRSAKQTTGIASINMTQLKALPVVLPPLEQQHVYLRRIEELKRRRAVEERALMFQDALFLSLQHRAFRGEL